MSNILLDFGIINCLARDKEELYNKYFLKGEYGLKENNDYNKKFFLGKIDNDFFNFKLEDPYNNKINKMALHAVNQLKPIIDEAKKRYKKNRISVIVGTCENGSDETKDYILKGSVSDERRILVMQSLNICCDFLQKYLDVSGPSFTISTACTSSANAVIAADELIRSNIIDVAIVGGADVVTDTVVYGFDSLEVVSYNKTNSFSKNRSGINLGEGAAFTVLARENFIDSKDAIYLKGYNSNSDSHHMTSPDIDGSTTSKCINDALKHASMNINNIDYINLHGTGTLINDKMESTTLNRVNASDIWCSSSKTSFGHTIGAAGAMELGVCFITLSSMNKEKILPPHLYDGEYDDTLEKIKLVNGKVVSDRLENCMSVSFGFGGSNTCLIVGK
ncbi:beta-ketoacyl synthase N-terminal-like domain-containing protein [Brachyspira innocens]|uniref:Beta-ketoacyl synthase N-terminal-like domain-containing protein n=1 Tax=Brachyspira innocens TaxID=13264 RepID=A0ABT8YW60_9SPIR|nr:beta-ketoacyl synthase N-terminal-like domain-containing protein [Brachyspira innocens]MDO6993021.1 beta-ketoacyl synthase N-terminal-like domain-containing protein [Brachyspira innocens]MDO7020094.1 beta-ketoacyl synthase N-terminal-like domain-containing protein [Brachyspira innocens]